MSRGIPGGGKPRECDFGFDLGVSFREEDLAGEGAPCSFGTQRFGGEEAPGLSVFAAGDDGHIYCTNSTYARGGPDPSRTGPFRP